MKANGYPYATKDTTSAASSSSCYGETGSNTEYAHPVTGDPGAYDYAIKVKTAGSLLIELYDPQFCARSTQQLDTGDATFSSANFNTQFLLYDPSDTPYDLTDDVPTTGGTFPNGNPSTYAGNGTSSPASVNNSCSTYYGSPAGNTMIGKWITYATIPAAQVGVYRLNVQTLAISGKSADGTNEFSIRATSGSGPQPEVYAGLAGTHSAMSIYTNVPSGTTYMYLAKISSAMAGKTMEVDLFDPGDVKGGAATAVMSFSMPTASGYADTPFVYRNSGTTLNDSGTTSGSVNSVTTSTCDTCHPFNGDWLVVTIKIPSTYTAPLDGWWKIKYVISATQPSDRTTWRAEIIDSPVHLVQ